MNTVSTYREILNAVSESFSGSETPFLDACLLLAHSLGLSRESLLARLPEQAPPLPAGFYEAVRRRSEGESIAYILGKKEFFGREFIVDSRVLVPRPDTEILVEAALEFGDLAERDHPGRLAVHDACTGSGAVAVSIAAERPGWTVSASDISEAALEVARANATKLLGKPLLLRVSNLLGAVQGTFGIITANPPYVPSHETDALLRQGWKEPRLALDGGIDGLSLIPELISQAYRLLEPGGFLLVETDSLQVPAVCAMFEKAGFVAIFVKRDLAGRDRVTGGRKPRA